MSKRVTPKKLVDFEQFQRLKDELNYAFRAEEPFSRRWMPRLRLRAIAGVELSDLEPFAPDWR